jgi:Domain of unknown function DUF302
VPDIGLLLPCNVIVREEAPARVVVGFLDPQIMVGLAGKPEIRAVADAAEQRLRRACASLGGSTLMGAVWSAALRSDHMTLFTGLASR